MKRQPAKILVIRFSSIGDIVLTAPVIDLLKKQFPTARIDFLTKRAYAPLWRGDDRVKVRYFDPEDMHYGLPGFRRFIRELQREHYDVVIDLHGLPKSRALTAALARPTLRYDKASLRRRMYVMTKRTPADLVHTARRYVRTLAPLGIDTEGVLNPSITPAERDRERIAGMVQPVGIRGRAMVALAPGAQWATKQWGWDRFGALIPRLNERGYWVALVGGKEDRDRCEELAMGHRALNFAGLLNLGETLAVFDFCQLVISNDSGPMHMASARGCDVIGLFGSTSRPLGFWPLAERSSVVEVEGLPCKPCSPHGRDACPQGHFRCMRDLSLERVWEEAERFLGPPPSDDPGDTEGVFYLGD
jgi:lipopolysaccharide heptosyltransferase II